MATRQARRLIPLLSSAVHSASAKMISSPKILPKWCPSFTQTFRQASSVTEAESGTVAIDRTGLSVLPELKNGPMAAKSEETELTKHIKALINFRNGPITVAEYMEEVLTNPSEGFYMNRDVFGRRGDFVTSPEISQLFGEMIGIWAVSLWLQMGSPSRIQIVELGPGRGTLMADLLRGTAQFGDFVRSMEVHLVEVSPALRSIQWETLKCGSEEDSSEKEQAVSGLSGTKLTWHLDLESVPRGIPAIIIAHEFFDALPVHQFQKTDSGWREKLVDVAEPSSPHHLRFVLSRTPTVASALYLPIRLQSMAAEEVQSLQQVEVCPWGLRLAKEIAKRVGEDGGGALIVDYGHDSVVEDSLQAIRKHKFVHVLDAPGTADLSSFVDFAALRQAVDSAKVGATCHGPVDQNKLLWSLGIHVRLEKLCSAAEGEEEVEELQLGYWRLTDDGECVIEGRNETEESRVVRGMGVQYKAMAVVNDTLGSPVGFE